MPDFSYHHFKLGRWHYVLLPKLNDTQIRLIATELEGRGFTVRRGQAITGVSKETVLHFGLVGLCWSSSDPADFILPLIPNLLNVTKQRVSRKSLLEKYFLVENEGKSSIVRLNTRLEAHSNWKALRESGNCALTPDEQSVASLLLASAAGTCSLITDFPSEGSRVCIVGTRVYYETELSVAECEETLRSLAMVSNRNSYLPKDARIRLQSFKVPRANVLAQALKEDCDWCPFSI